MMIITGIGISIIMIGTILLAIYICCYRAVKATLDNNDELSGRYLYTPLFSTLSGIPHDRSNLYFIYPNKDKKVLEFYILNDVIDFSECDDDFDKLKDRLYKKSITTAPIFNHENSLYLMDKKPERIKKQKIDSMKYNFVVSKGFFEDFLLKFHDDNICDILDELWDNFGDKFMSIGVLPSGEIICSIIHSRTLELHKTDIARNIKYMDKRRKPLIFRQIFFFCRHFKENLQVSE